MADQTQRLEIATVRAEVGSNIVFRFANDAANADSIPTQSGSIQNLKQVVLEIQQDAAEKISISTTIYPTVAAGLSATADQGIFLVQSNDADEIYAVWQNQGGTAVSTGKTALSASAIQTALDASNEAAQAAEDAADTAAERTAGFLPPSTEPPATRANGLPLQDGDRYLDLNTGYEMIWFSGEFRTNNLSAADIENPSDPDKGAALVGWDGENVSVQLAQSKKLRSYQEIRDYRGIADRIIIRTKKYAGTFLKRAKLLGDVDDGGMKLVSSDGLVTWEREFTGPVQACWFGPMGAGVDSALAVNAAVNAIAAKSPAFLFGSGGEVDVGSGRLNIKTPVISKFGVTLRGGGTDLYTSCFSVDPDFAGEAAVVLRSDSYASYTNGHLKNIAVSCNNVPGAGGVLFAGAYNNSSIQDCLITGVNGASIGLEVRPMSSAESPTAITACESLLLKDLYVLHHDLAETVTQPTIKLTRCQETTLLNVKAFSGRNNAGSVPTSQSAILLRDCRGITTIGGAAVGAKYGITIEAVTKDVSGFCIINPTYENVSDQGLRVVGMNGFTVSGVDQGVPRYEAPNPSYGFYSENCRNSSVHTGIRGWSLGVGSVGMDIRDFGSGPTAADGSARYSRHVPPNSSNNRNLIDSSAGQEVHAPSTPGHRYTAGSRSNYWQLQWVASDSVDSGFRLINSSNRSAWHAGDNGAEVTLGFFNKSPIIRPTVSGIRGTAAMDALLLKALSDLGLINDQTTAP
ncbi:hypothetical protein R4370_003953 [Pseudomonas putida]|nr:hypothetical protein [Pseudomonas putida]